MATDNPLDAITNPATWAFKIIGFFMSVALMVSSFFLKSAWERIDSMEKGIHELEINLSHKSQNEFDINDWIIAKNEQNIKEALLDRRITRLEESMPYIKESLSKIEAKLDKR